MAETVVFVVCALGAVASGVAVFVVDSMARATFALLASFLFAAVPLLLLGLSYLGVLVVLMMVMEMMVMVVFMIMYMMNPAGLMPMSMVHNKAGALTVAAVTFAVLAAGVLLVPWPAREGSPPGDPTLQLAEAIMGPHMLVMMLVGMVLFATMVASVVLSTPRGRYDRYGDDLRRPRPDDPIRGGVGR
ncbi:NADH-quinone oxidoreductase subunit J [Nocardiopsis sp. NRRL B-16309]|uniref:NADH-quinone oxidoreductase subunit J n=1 Tax=Nocardiopsis sp. NRRL B-16309 TaxID=1519494 RepID=UPI0006AE0A9F|nr:NADH-quinone oxidoreductase subunit J [Nocardiopsis sp. NRRL B-16309]KOX10013.1 NADH:ubiquinone oxidoreductase subunit J [Nocardiopsis sp. NRRL B-16309]